MNGDDRNTLALAGTPAPDKWARQFRQKLIERNITPPKWARLMELYLADPTNKIGHDRRSRSTARNNLTRELQSPRFTQAVFYKAMKFVSYELS